MDQHTKKTFSSLSNIVRICQKATYDLGWMKGKNKIWTQEEHFDLVLAVSKAILDELPCNQLENDEIEEIISEYEATLTKLEAQ